MWCFVRFCTILYNFNGSVLLSVKLHFLLCNVSKSKHFHGCFSFLYCTGCTKSHKASHMEFSLLLLSSIYGRDAISEDNIQFSRTVLTFWNQVFESENCLIYTKHLNPNLLPDHSSYLESYFLLTKRCISSLSHVTPVSPWSGIYVAFFTF